MALSLAVHLVGIVGWLGGVMLLTRLLLSVAADTASLPMGFRRALYRSYVGFVLGGMAVTVGSGLFQLMVRGPGFYFSQGWFHTKLSLVFLLIALTVVGFVQVCKAQRGEPVSRGALGATHGLSAIFMVVTLAVTLVGLGR